MKLKIMDIERFAIHDGPGIRSTIFLQGCPLHCPWCSNPESQKIGHWLMHQKKKCVGCGTCAAVCPAKAIHMKNGFPVFDRERCLHCGSCAANCLNSAITYSGTDTDIDEIVQTVLRDRDYYENSGGGVTVSGGEPFEQFEGFQELLLKLHDNSLHTAVETTGNVPPMHWDKCIPLIDLFLLDIKHPDPNVLKRVTGADLQLILSNLRRLPKDKVIVRTPVIPDFNYDETTIRNIFRIALDHDVQQVDLLPYHVLGMDKYGQLGRDYLWHITQNLTKKDIEPLKEIGRGMGLTVL